MIDSQLATKYISEICLIAILLISPTNTQLVQLVLQILDFSNSPHSPAMPSHIAAEVLIQLHAFGGLPWVYPVWQELTGMQHGLFPHDDQDLPKGWTRNDARDIQSFFHQYNQIPPKETTAHQQFASGKNDIIPGRKKWAQFVQNRWKSWGIEIHPLTIINSNGIPIHIDGVFNNAAWPHSDLYIPAAIDTIAMSIFGPGAFGDADILPSPL